MNIPWRVGLTLIVTMFLGIRAGSSKAQATEKEPPFKVTQVAIEPMPDLFKVGKGATFHGTVDEKGHGFELPGLGMLNPVAITVIADDPKQPLTLKVGETWTSDDRVVTTDDQGLGTARFRTDDLAKIRVMSPSGTRGFGIMIWVGDERTDYPDMGSAITYGQKDKAKSGKGQAPTASPTPPAPGSAVASQPPASTPSPAEKSSGTSPVLYVIAGLLAALVALVAIVVLRRKS